MKLWNTVPDETHISIKIVYHMPKQLEWNGAFDSYLVIRQ